MDKIYTEWISRLTLMFVNKIGKNFYEILTSDLHISRRDVSGVVRGEDIRIHHYIRIIDYVMESIHLTIELTILLKELRKVLNEEHDLLIATMPHKKKGTPAPESWSVVIKWHRR